MAKTEQWAAERREHDGPYHTAICQIDYLHEDRVGDETFFNLAVTISIPGPSLPFNDVRFR